MTLFMPIAALSSLPERQLSTILYARPASGRAHDPAQHMGMQNKSVEANMKTVAELLKLKGVHQNEVHTVGPDQMVIDAVKLMAEKNIGAVPVVQGETVVGIVSERDYARKMELKGRASVGTPIRDIMTSEVRTVAPTDMLEECMTIMTEYRLRHLPVVEAGKLIGLLSIGDLVKEAIAEQASLIQQMETYMRGESY